jgi:hypothetical protein
MTPPSAWISKTSCDFPGPPMAGLQGMRPMVSGFGSARATRAPIRAAATAASIPACPPPTTITSNDGTCVSSWRGAPGLPASAREPGV